MSSQEMEINHYATWIELASRPRVMVKTHKRMKNDGDWVGFERRQVVVKAKETYLKDK